MPGLGRHRARRLRQIGKTPLARPDGHGAGKTFTSITFIYRLLKHARIKRVLFLVDTRKLGEQAEQEFRAFQPSDDNRKFTELYSVRRNFQTWIMRRHAGIPTEKKFTETQTAFLQLIRDHVMTSFRFERDDLDYAPFDAQAGLGKMHQLFGDSVEELIEELNGELVA